MEIIEHKGYGHPDSITDSVVENCASELDKYYVEKYDRPLHYNIDKAVFLAGDINAGFGTFYIKKKPCFILGGQVSEINDEVKSILTSSIRATVEAVLPLLLDFDIEIRVGNVSRNLSNIATNVVSNDTSFGVGYWPLSGAENTVLNIRDAVNKMISDGVIPIGPDYKIMYTPNSISLSAPLYSTKVNSRDEYAEWKKKIEGVLSVFGKVVFNPDFDFGFPYLSVCGSSIECGDDGQVGRGNRYNGLITPCKPMTIEAYCGKNNTNHVGKMYQKMATEKAKEVYEREKVYTEVIMVSKIGAPIDDYELYISHPTI